MPIKFMTTPSLISVGAITYDIEGFFWGDYMTQGGWPFPGRISFYPPKEKDRGSMIVLRRCANTKEWYTHEGTDYGIIVKGPWNTHEEAVIDVFLDGGELS